MKYLMFQSNRGFGNLGTRIRNRNHWWYWYTLNLKIGNSHDKKHLVLLTQKHKIIQKLGSEGDSYRSYLKYLYVRPRKIYTKRSIRDTAIVLCVVFWCKTKSLETSRPRRGNWVGPAKGPTSHLRQSSKVRTKLSQKQTYPVMKRQSKHIICLVSPWKKKNCQGLSEMNEHYTGSTLYISL